MPEKNNFKEITNYVLIAGLFILAAVIIYPIVYSIIYGILFAYIFYPLHRFLTKKIKNEFLSSLFICIGLLLIIVGIFALTFGVIFRESINFFLFLQKADLAELFRNILPAFISSSTVSDSVASSLNTYISGLIAEYINNFTTALSDLPSILIQLTVIIFTFFFALKDGKKAIEYVKSLSLFKKETEDKFFKQFRDITSSVLIGHMVVGVVQGLMAGLGYFVFGVPNAILLTVITVIAAIIPVVGPWLVWVPVDIYLFGTGNTSAGLGLLIYGLVVISWIDNVIRSMIVSRKTQLNTGIVMIGMFGGLFAFGFLGLIIGPLILAYVLLVIELFRKSTVSEDLIFKKPE
ncbi:MAG: AI-2E family transporter [Candidatus Pacearchaeota archaeon]|jgi:predicted PurR-regulated permease PerM